MEPEEIRYPVETSPPVNHTLWSNRRLFAESFSLGAETATDSAVRFLRTLIFSGELGPGDKLPPERELSAYLGLSRVTVRLALKVLESTGYLVTTRGAHGGSRVADTASLIECWKAWMRQHMNDLDDIFELRLTVETRLAALAAERRTEEDLAIIEALVAQDRDSRAWSSLFRNDIEIHRSIARAARSPRLEKAMMSARAEFFVPVDLAKLENKGHEVHDSHQAILVAIRNQDPASASEQMRKHILLIRELTDRALRTAGLLSGARHPGAEA